MSELHHRGSVVREAVGPVTTATHPIILLWAVSGVPGSDWLLSTERRGGAAAPPVERGGTAAVRGV